MLTTQSETNTRYSNYIEYNKIEYNKIEYNKYIGYHDDDENCLIHHMVVKKDNLDECYRIVFRMARKNGDDFVWSFIIKVFLDFYAELNPKMEHFIFKLKTEWKENIEEDEDAKKSDDGDDNYSVMLFAYIVKNMFIRKSVSYNVYNTRIGVLKL